MTICIIVFCILTAEELELRSVTVIPNEATIVPEEEAVTGLYKSRLCSYVAITIHLAIVTRSQPLVDWIRSRAFRN